MSNNEKFDLKRALVPNSSVLQASIIAEAESLPQYHQFAASPVRQKKGWLRTLRVAGPFAFLCLFALLVLISPDNWFATEPDLNNLLATSEDFDWPDLMLLEDEWLFTEL